MSVAVVCSKDTRKRTSKSRDRRSTWGEQPTSCFAGFFYPFFNPRITGFLLPILLFGLFVKWETLFGVETRVVTTLLLAWMLLSIDSILSLGVAANLINLAKGIKELK